MMISGDPGSRVPDVERPPQSVQVGFVAHRGAAALQLEGHCPKDEVWCSFSDLVYNIQASFNKRSGKDAQCQWPLGHLEDECPAGGQGINLSVNCLSELVHLHRVERTTQMHTTMLDIVAHEAKAYMGCK